MKKLIVILLFLSLLMSLCSCKESESTNQTEELLSIEMQLNLLLSLEDVNEANKLVIDGVLYLKQSNFKESKTKHEEALAKLNDVERKMESVIDSPNFIHTDIETLQEQFEKMIHILDKGMDMSVEEFDQLVLLEKEATMVQSELMMKVQCFSNLYTIRKFDELPDEEAKNELDEVWWEFQFDESIECPETINEEELYLLWARKFSENFSETEEFLNDLNRLREAEYLTSKSNNKEWCDFVETYILGTWTEAELTASVF